MKHVLLALVVLSGCATAQMMETSGSAYAPMNERPGGTVRYLAAGIPPIQKARRADAYKQMYESCGGRYSITNEYSENAGSITTGSATSNGNTASGFAVTNTGSWRYIAFECGGRIRRDEPSPSDEADASPVQLRQEEPVPAPAVPEPPRRALTNPAIQARVGAQVNCPGDGVVIEKVAVISTDETGYRVRACGAQYSCMESSRGTACAAVATR